MNQIAGLVPTDASLTVRKRHFPADTAKQVNDTVEVGAVSATGKRCQLSCLHVDLAKFGSGGFRKGYISFAFPAYPCEVAHVLASPVVSHGDACFSSPMTTSATFPAIDLAGLPVMWRAWFRCSITATT